MAGMRVTFVGLLSLTLSIHAQPSASCSFPTFLTQRPRWESHIYLNRRATEIFWKFHDETAEKVDYSDPDGTVNDSYTCVDNPRDNTYLIKLQQSDSYLCVKYLERSDYIVQVKKSAESTTADPQLCDQLELDPWPLVWPEADSRYYSCPLNGGYNFYQYDVKTDETICESSLALPKIESECMAGEGFHWQFRSFNCRGRLSVEVEQKMDCLGTWTDRGYGYTILTDNDDLWPKLWLLRYPVEHGEDFTAHLKNEIYVDAEEIPAPGSDVIILHMSRAPTMSLCEDEINSCGSTCSLELSSYCHQTCDMCGELNTASSCRFGPEFRGYWLQESAGQTQHITVGESVLHPDGLHPFTCTDLDANFLYDDVHYETLVTNFDNGCRARFTCAEFRPLTKHVIQYRLSQSVIWQTGYALNALNVCPPSQFTNDPPPLNDIFRSQNLRPLVRNRPSGTPRSSVRCLLHGKYLLDAKYKSQNCTAHLNTCEEDSHHFTLSNHSGSDEASTQRHACLASFEEDGQQFVITEDVSDLSTWCWVFYKEDWDLTYTIYLLHSADCHTDTGRDIKFRGYTRHVAEFTVHPGNGYRQSYYCSDSFPSTMTTTTTSTTTTSTPSTTPPSSPEKTAADTNPPTPVSDRPTPVSDGPTPDSDRPTPVSNGPAPDSDRPTPEADSPTPKTDSPTPKTDSPTPKTNSPTPKTNSPTPKTDSPTPGISSPPDLKTPGTKSDMMPNYENELPPDIHDMDELRPKNEKQIKDRSSAVEHQTSVRLMGLMAALTLLLFW